MANGNCKPSQSIPLFAFNAPVAPTSGHTTAIGGMTQNFVDASPGLNWRA
jgi:hypothetical protein